MPLSGISVAEIGVGGLILYSGIKGYSIADTFSYLTKGKKPAQTEPITQADYPSASDSPGGGSATGVASGSDTANLHTIAAYLMSQGFTEAAAAGVTGVIAGESGGNPEAKQAGGGGIGLIQWTGASQTAADGFTPLTGNATKDLDAQLPGILKYIESRGGNALEMIKNMTDPHQAADLFSQYEAPAVPGSDINSGVVAEIYNWLIGKG